MKALALLVSFFLPLQAFSAAGETTTRIATNNLQQLLKQADGGDASAQFTLGVIYSEGKEVEKNASEALRWYRRAAKNGNADAQYVIGTVYYGLVADGRGIAADTGVGWFRKAAEQGHAAALSALRKAAEEGHAEAQYELSIIYRSGKGASKNGELAAQWTRRSAGNGYPLAQYYLGLCYENGWGLGLPVEIDYEAAVKWYRKAAEQGYVPALIALGDSYRYGEGVKQDMAVAVEWYQQAAEQGDEADLLDYYPGMNWYKQYLKAVEQLRETAEQGDVDAQFLLSQMYAKGEGVPKDVGEALRWLELSADGGNPLARERLDALQRSSRELSAKLMRSTIPELLQRRLQESTKKWHDQYLKRNPLSQRPSESVDEWAERVRKEMEQR